MTTGSEPRYVQPDLGTRVFNSAVAALTRAGVSVWGSRVLAVRGRTSGLWRTTPVNPLTLNGERYLVAPRGETQWVRNMRAAGGGELRVGRRAEPFTATELADADKPPVLRLPQALEVRDRHVLPGRGPRRSRRQAARDRARLPGLPGQPTRL